MEIRLMKMNPDDLVMGEVVLTGGRVLESIKHVAFPCKLQWREGPPMEWQDVKFVDEKGRPVL